MKLLNVKKNILKLIEKEWDNISPNYRGATIPGLLRCVLGSLVKKKVIENWHVNKIKDYRVEFTVVFNINGNKVIQEAYLNY